METEYQPGIRGILIDTDAHSAGLTALFLGLPGSDNAGAQSTAGGVQSESIGQQVAWNNASINYVQQAGSFLRGRIDTDTHAGGGDAGEFSNFYAAYETLLQKEIRGELRPSYTLIRSRADGTYQVMAFFVVNEEAAVNARIRAAELAAKESEVAQQLADRIRKYVKEGFDE